MFWPLLMLDSTGQHFLLKSGKKVNKRNQKRFFLHLIPDSLNSGSEYLFPLSKNLSLMITKKFPMAFSFLEKMQPWTEQN